MRSSAARLPDDDYVLMRDATEYERLRAQARAWQSATSRVFDQVALGLGARCLDAGCGPGHRLPLLFEDAGLGTSDGTDVAGKLESLRSGGWLFAEIYRSVLPLAVRLGLSTRASYDQWSNTFARDAAAYPNSALLWPLLIGAWKRKPAVQAAP